MQYSENGIPDHRGYLEKRRSGQYQRRFALRLPVLLKLIATLFRVTGWPVSLSMMIRMRAFWRALLMPRLLPNSSSVGIGVVTITGRLVMSSVYYNYCESQANIAYPRSSMGM